MNSIIVLSLLVAVACAAPLDPPQTAQILRYESDNIGVDGYRFAYETSDGIARQEQAVLKNLGPDVNALNVQGTVSWVAPDGQTYTVNYVADENGFRPEGAHLPKA